MTNNATLNSIFLFITVGILCGTPSPAHCQTRHINVAWLTSHAPAPYYLDEANTTFILDNDVSTTGTAFAIVQPGVVFDLNGHTVTYNNSASIVVANGSFEDGEGRTSPAWDLTQAPAAIIGTGPFEGPVAWTGPKALRFSVPVASGPGSIQSVRSLSPVTLLPNTTYSLSFRVFNGVAGPKANGGNDLEFFIQFQGTLVEATRASRTWRGFERIHAEYTTGGTAETLYVVIGLRHADSALNQAGTVYIDDVRVETRGTHGVVVGPLSYRASWYPDLNRYGGANGAIVKNGRILQGSGSGDRSHSIFVTSGANTEIAGLSTTVQGPNCQNLATSYVSGLNIHDNTFSNNVDVISSRDAFDGTVVQAGLHGRVERNKIIGGCQNGIVAEDGAQILDNEIALRSRYTNGFAVQLWSTDDVLVQRNKISCGTGDFSCRGIFTGGDAQRTKIFDNQVEVQELPRNQEYNGGQGGVLSGAYGIQVETSDDIEIARNDVTAFAWQWSSSAFRMNAAAEDRGNYVHDNIFRALKTGRGAFTSNDENTLVAMSVKIGGGIDSAALQLRFEQNELATNSRWIACSSMSNLEFRDTTFNLAGTPMDTFQPLVAERYRSDGADAITGIRFVHPRFGSPEARTALMDGKIYKKFYSNFGIDPYSSFIVSWPLNAHFMDREGQPVAGGTITVLSGTGGTAFAGTSGGLGEMSVFLDDFREQGGARQQFNPYRLEISKLGVGSRTEELMMNQSRELHLVIAPDAVAPRAPLNLRIPN